MIRLVLPWPDKVLNPNNRSHWGARAKAAATAKAAAYVLTSNLQVKLDPLKKYRVDLIFYPPNKRAWDLDNLTAAMKAALDGMCRALGIDDRMIRPVPDWGKIQAGGQVEVLIREADVIESDHTRKETEYGTG